MDQPALSIVIPAYNRPAPLINTLASAQALLPLLRCEIILVDDGSQPSLIQQLPETALVGVRVLEQANAGSIQARLNGLASATGDFVKFLDSDDLLEPDGVLAQVACLQQTTADAVYGDIRAQQHSEQFAPPRKLSVEQFVLDVQPAPHAPMYRRCSLLAAKLSQSRLPGNHLFCATGDVWLFAGLLGQDWVVHYLPGYVGSVSTHQDGRYSDCWERLGLVGGSLLWCLACLHRHDTELSKRIARKALSALITLPSGAPKVLDDLCRATWLQLDPERKVLAEFPKYHRMSLFLGFEAALWLARKRRKHAYTSIQTLSAESVVSLAANLRQSMQDHGFPVPWPEPCHA